MQQHSFWKEYEERIWGSGGWTTSPNSSWWEINICKDTTHCKINTRIFDATAMMINLVMFIYLPEDRLWFYELTTNYFGFMIVSYCSFNFAIRLLLTFLLLCFNCSYPNIMLKYYGFVQYYLFYPLLTESSNLSTYMIRQKEKVQRGHSKQSF